MTNRWAVLALIMAAQVMANVGPLGIPSIAPLIRENLGLSVTQAGSSQCRQDFGKCTVHAPLPSPSSKEWMRLNHTPQAPSP